MSIARAVLLLVVAFATACGEPTGPDSDAGFDAGTGGDAGGPDGGATDAGVLAAPGFDPPPGRFAAAVSVTLTGVVEGATAYFTLDDSAPAGAFTAVTGPVPVTSTATLRAFQRHPVLGDSAVASGTYEVDAIAPGPSEIRGAVTVPDPAFWPFVVVAVFQVDGVAQDRGLRVDAIERRLRYERARDGSRVESTPVARGVLEGDATATTRPFRVSLPALSAGNAFLVPGVFLDADGDGLFDDRDVDTFGDRSGAEPSGAWEKSFDYRGQRREGAVIVHFRRPIEGGAGHTVDFFHPEGNLNVANESLAPHGSDGFDAPLPARNTERPAGFTAVDTGTGGVRLSWTASASALVGGYRVTVGTRTEEVAGRTTTELVLAGLPPYLATVATLATVDLGGTASDTVTTRFHPQAARVGVPVGGPVATVAAFQGRAAAHGDDVVVAWRRPSDGAVEVARLGGTGGWSPLGTVPGLAAATEGAPSLRVETGGVWVAASPGSGTTAGVAHHDGTAWQAVVSTPSEWHPELLDCDGLWLFSVPNASRDLQVRRSAASPVSFGDATAVTQQFQATRARPACIDGAPWVADRAGTGPGRRVVLRRPGVAANDPWVEVTLPAGLSAAADPILVSAPGVSPVLAVETASGSAVSLQAYRHDPADGWLALPVLSPPGTNTTGTTRLAMLDDGTLVAASTRFTASRFTSAPGRFETFLHVLGDTGWTLLGQAGGDGDTQALDVAADGDSVLVFANVDGGLRVIDVPIPD